MEGISLKSRAIAFAVCIGAAAFILALLASNEVGSEGEALTRALIVSLVCGIMSWASAERSIATIAGSIDAAIARIVSAAQGDLTSPTPPEVAEGMPELSSALDILFGQVRSNLESVHALAMFDPVTSLANRTNFRREADRALRGLSDDAKSALLFIDLDNFKSVNDTYGHAQGDQLLGMVANRLRVVAGAEANRAGAAAAPVVGRLAGDEFTILFPKIDDENDAARIARGLLAALTEPFELQGHCLDVGASIGVALRPEGGRSLTTLMRAADVAMYHAKASGRGQFQFYSDALAQRVAHRSQLEIELREAIQREEFALVVQPQVSLASGSLVAGEVLLRWNHPVDGLRTPATFMEAAEESGHIFEIGNWSIDAVCKVASEWAERGLSHRLAVNLSPRQVNRVDFFPRLRAAFAKYGATPAMFEIELTETLAMSCGAAVLREIAMLRSEGAIISIDDFGAGISNLSLLRQLPVDRVKIDGSLIADIATDPAARSIVQAVIGLIHGLGYESVAEGVETADQIDVLRVMGCTAVQGFAIAHPMPEADFMAWNSIARPSLTGTAG